MSPAPPPVAAPAPSVQGAQVGFARDLARHGDRVALVQDTVAGTRAVSYRDLATSVADEAATLGRERRLVLLALDRTIEAVTSYLAVLTAGHVAILAPESDREIRTTLARAYDPDLVIERVDGVWTTTERHIGTTHDLHPDLCVLLSTSGSTGSPKLVRLSHENLQSNADAIAAALDITAADRAVTTLPLTYSYGLSVLHSHLTRGASVLLAEDSVVDPRLWDALARHRVTSLPGVPHTFDLLDRVGFERQRLPDLRRLTVAGGRLRPDRVEHYASLGRRRGYRLFVMYGQTEATARITVLDPDLAPSQPDSIGRPVPGGQVRIVPVPGQPDGVGEIVYRGPNVMLGYAEGPADLAIGRTVDELHTGDLGTRSPDGTLRVVGRTTRLAKLFGLRIDLDRVEQLLADQGIDACVLSDETGLCVVAAGRHDPEHIADCAARAAGLPQHVVRASVLPELPRLASGKVDRGAALAACPGASDPAGGPVGEPTGTVTPDQVTALYARLLGRPDATTGDSFVSLGGDSLSFVELSVRLEALLGDLPSDWHTQTPRQLAETSAAPRRWSARIDTGVALRALAIVAIVGTHIGVFELLGGAHVLLALAGFSMARFLLDPRDSTAATPRVLRAAARIAVPSAVWIAAVTVVTGQYGWNNVMLLGTVLGPPEWGEHWHFWFVEALVLYLLVAASLVAVPTFARAERRWPFAVSGALVALGLVIRFGLMPGLEDPRPTPAPAIYFFWFFALGWWAARAGRRWQQLLVSAVVLLAVPGYWELPWREGLVVIGLLTLVWLPTIRVPRGTVPTLTRLAAASLAIYLTHWSVYPLLETTPWLALLASLAVGVVVYEAARAAVKAAKSRSFWSAYVSAYSAKARSALSPVPK